MTDNKQNDNKQYGHDKSDGQPNETTSSTEMTDQQAATNDLQGPGRGARQEPGAHESEQQADQHVKSDARGDLPDIPSMDRANQADQE
ncbi:hypothetical protein D3875_12920 [Deinococcus cavernae]|uniref:Uncharacterized protein n=1 Tax=Deinococcus cavernae TaxID=2320857 RepID=A0A418V889_9DEIO|nr:hypothetical protein [Deinococcus cavernae]RJF72315.1 hypothetical protein D3875_12920 [Deinococcus cavernae]